MLELTVRLIASLAVVVGLLLLLARFAGRRFAGRADAPVQVLHRQPLSRSSAVAVVSVGSRILVLGTTDQQIQLLTELDPEDLETTALELVAAEVEELPELHAAPAVPAPVRRVADRRARRTPAPAPARRAGAHRAAPAARATADQGALTGSVLSTTTWRQAFAAASGKAS